MIYDYPDVSQITVYKHKNITYYIYLCGIAVVFIIFIHGWSATDDNYEMQFQMYDILASYVRMDIYEASSK